MTALERLNILKDKAMKELDAIGVKYTAPVAWKLSKATSTWGTTHRKKNVATGKFEYVIRISLMTLDKTISDEMAKDTIIHELIHTVPGCWNHGDGFKKVAELVNDCYACYHISRTADTSKMGLSREAYESYKVMKGTVYNLSCDRCGFNYQYRKMTNLVKILQRNDGRATTSNYYCTKCGCHTFILK